MRVLVGCECSGIVRDAFITKGHDAWSCDIKPTERPGPHIKGDLLGVLATGNWQLAILHPPCTHLSCSGAAWFPAKVADGRQQSAIEFFMKMVNAPVPRIAIENPVGVMSTHYRKPDQIIQPYHFGDEAQKTTCLWLKRLPLLSIEAPLFHESKVVGKGEFVIAASGKKGPKWHSDTRSLPPDERSTARSRTFQGIADAMAEQWNFEV